uniref:Uncharacterized protein n=1 Tax=Trichoderma aureoviride TaxID=64502 RepID=A0A060N9C4_9HYPO|nr:hypothetical protein [Trichoderma aureoviride]
MNVSSRTCGGIITEFTTPKPNVNVTKLLPRRDLCPGCVAAPDQGARRRTNQNSYCIPPRGFFYNLSLLGASRRRFENESKLSTTDLLVLASMKNAAKCDKCELQNSVNHRIFERTLRPPVFWRDACPSVISTLEPLRGVGVGDRPCLGGGRLRNTVAVSPQPLLRSSLHTRIGSAARPQPLNTQLLKC